MHSSAKIFLGSVLGGCIDLGGEYWWCTWSGAICGGRLLCYVDMVTWLFLEMWPVLNIFKVQLYGHRREIKLHCQAAQLPLACIWVLLLPACIWWLLLCCSTFTALVRCQRPSRCADATIILGAAAVAGHLLTVTGLTLKNKIIATNWYNWLTVKETSKPQGTLRPHF